MFSFLKHPRKRYLYAIITGDYCGQMLALVESENTNYQFLVLPTIENRAIDKQKFKFALDNKIVEPVERLPKNIYNFLVEQYKYNKCNK